MIIICPHCKKEADIKNGYINRARKLGVPRYCSKKCSGLARKIYRTESEKKLIKKNYDKQYRDRGYVYMIKAVRFFYDYENNPEKYRTIRRKKQKAHNEYCRRPEYREYKKEYDHAHKHKLKYGEFWEAASILTKLNEILPSKQIKYNQGLINKSQKRKRKWLTQTKNLMQKI